MLGPGIGSLELVVIGLVALIVVGPKDLPVLMRKVGQFLGRARKMASEFRASFDDMARQSELDDLRKEVEALRTGQIASIEKDTTSALKALDRDLRESPSMKAVTTTPPMTEPRAPDPVPPAAEAPVEPAPEPAEPAKPRKPRSKAPAK